MNKKLICLFSILFLFNSHSFANDNEETINYYKGFLDRGIENFNYKDYDNALINFMQCNKFFISCVHNTGSTYLKLGDMEKANEWYMLSARYGHEPSAVALKNQGLPVPAADLKPTKPQTNNEGLSDALTGAINALNAVIGGYNRGADSALRNRPRNASCTTIGNTTDCYEY